MTALGGAAVAAHLLLARGAQAASRPLPRASLEGEWADRCSPEYAALGERELRPGELKGVSYVHLAILRNVIFARRGRSFESPFWRDLFAPCGWTGVPAKLNHFERHNVLLINRLERKEWKRLKKRAPKFPEAPVVLTAAHQEESFLRDLDGDRQPDLITLHQETPHQSVISVNGQMTSADRRDFAPADIEGFRALGRIKAASQPSTK